MEFTIRDSADRESVVAYINALPEGGSYTIKVTRMVRKRTIPQNRLYRLWLKCIADETGDDVESLHKYFARRYLGVEEKKVFGEIIEEPLSTTKLNSQQFTDYLEQVNSFASDLHILLPNPDDKYWEAFYEHYGQD